MYNNVKTCLKRSFILNKLKNEKGNNQPNGLGRFSDNIYPEKNHGVKINVFNAK
jgi:hypothetical protein